MPVYPIQSLPHERVDWQMLLTPKVVEIWPCDPPKLLTAQALLLYLHR